MRATYGEMTTKLGTYSQAGGSGEPSQDWSLEGQDLGFEKEQERSKRSLSLTP